MNQIRPASDSPSSPVRETREEPGAHWLAATEGSRATKSQGMRALVSIEPLDLSQLNYEQDQSLLAPTPLVFGELVS
jgi:hypothetical protein